MKINSKLLKEKEEYVSDLITNKSSSNLTYHTIDHSKRVVKNAIIIGTKENLNDDDMNILKACAWFHDTGYIKKYQGNGHLI